ncbi:MAG: hypothetical protein ABIO44_03060 [Saprospiraceae bacterium]
MIVISLSNIKSKPLYQAGFCLLLAGILQLGYYALRHFQKVNSEPIEIWSLCPTLLLLYILINVVCGFNSEKINNYYRDSIYGFLGFLLLDIGLCNLLTGVAFDEVKSISQILFVFGIVYLVFMSILNLIRFIVALALKQDQRIQDENKKP